MAPYPVVKSIPGLLAVAVTFLLMTSATAQMAAPVEWSMLVDPDAQVYEDPYRELSRSQMDRLMALARTRQSLHSGPVDAAQRDMLENRAAGLYEELEAEGLDPDEIVHAPGQQPQGLGAQVADANLKAVAHAPTPYHVRYQTAIRRALGRSPMDDAKRRLCRGELARLGPTH